MGQAKQRKAAGLNGGARGPIHEHIVLVDDALDRGERGIEAALKAVNEERARQREAALRAGQAEQSRRLGPLGYGDFLVYALVTRGLEAFWQASDAEQRKARLILEPRELGKAPAQVLAGR